MPLVTLSRAASTFAWAVALSGLVVGAATIALGRPAAWTWTAIGVFGVAGVLVTFLSVTYRGFMPTSIAFEIGSAFAYALFFLEHPGATVLVLWVQAASGWIFKRMRKLTGLFNLGQLGLATVAAWNVRHWIAPEFTTLNRFDGTTLAAVFLSAGTFFLVNHGLTFVMVSLASRRPLLSLGNIQWTGALNETMCIASGVAMAALWHLSPWLSVVPAIPLALALVVLVRLADREQVLEKREVELGSLQSLGLELGSELDANRLPGAVVRAAMEALKADDAILLALEESSGHVRALARAVSERGLPGERRPSDRLRESFDAEGVVRVEGNGDPESLTDGLAVPEARGVLLAPLKLQASRHVLLVVLRGPARRPFDAEDERRLESLSRFVRVALLNAHLVTDLREMQQHLVQNEKMTALGMLVSGVAHELNNPLTSVLGYAELLLSRDRDPKRNKMLESVVSEAERAARIVRNLLTFSRKHPPEKRPTDLNEILTQVLELRAYEHRLMGLDVETRLDPDLPRVMIDPNQFQQVLLNLITNAEHALEGLGDRGKILLETDVAGGAVRIRITDNGPGIPKANLGKVFLPFFTTKEVGKGTGLGLSICYGIVQEHGGSVRAERAEGGGARFVVEIPVELPPAVLEPGVPQKTSRRSSPPAGSLLVVDDEPLIADLVRDAMEPQGWAVLSARDGVEALEILSREDFDVLLVDLRMPGMDGTSFYEAIHMSRPGLARRVVFATGYASDEATREFLEASGNPVLTKPYTVESLRRIVDEVGGAEGRLDNP